MIPKVQHNISFSFHAETHACHQMMTNQTGLLNKPEMQSARPRVEKELPSKQGLPRFVERNDRHESDMRMASLMASARYGYLTLAIRY